MEIGQRSAKKQRIVKQHIALGPDDYNDDITLYSFPPVGNIGINEVQDMVDERLAILAVFEDMKLDTATTRNVGEYLRTIRERVFAVPSNSRSGDNFIKVSFQTLGSRNPSKIEARRRDHISHFLLRLYFCKSEETKRWFISRETDLLRFRLMESDAASLIPTLIARNGLNYETVHLDQSKESDKQLKFKAHWNSFAIDDKGPIYRIIFEEALDVVRTRRAYIQGGYAYVTAHDMISILCNKFKQELSLALGYLSVYLPDEDSRLIPLVKNAHHRLEASCRKLKATASGELKEMISPEDIDRLSAESFPPCMENIHNSLRKNHHLKYHGRLHYGLFLKGIGLSLEDAIKFFREEFIQGKTPPEKFDKEYKYGIRYNYGKEGKKTDFSPFGCNKIINSVPGPQEVHGCPFKHFDKKNLKNFLSKKGVPDETLENIQSLVDEGSYQGACTVYFSLKHPRHQLPDDGIQHPNQFYEESRKALRRNPHREDMMDDEDDSYLDTLTMIEERVEGQTELAKEEENAIDAQKNNDIVMEEPMETNESSPDAENEPVKAYVTSADEEKRNSLTPDMDTNASKLTEEKIAGEEIAVNNEATVESPSIIESEMPQEKEAVSSAN